MSSALLVLSTACGDAGTAPDPDPIALEAVPIRLAQLECGKTYECCSAEEIDRHRFAGSSEANCSTNRATVHSQLVVQVREAETLGYVRYDASGMARCLENLENGTCGNLATDRCPEGLIPLVLPGGTCRETFECIGGNCIGGGGGTDGICGEPLPAGAPCRTDFDCQGRYCPPDGTCTTRGAAGATCSRDDDCVSAWCREDSTCGPETACQL